MGLQNPATKISEEHPHSSMAWEHHIAGPRGNSMALGPGGDTGCPAPPCPMHVDPLCPQTRPGVLSQQHQLLLAPLLQLPQTLSPKSISGCWLRGSPHSPCPPNRFWAPTLPLLLLRVPLTSLSSCLSVCPVNPICPI